MKIDFNQVLTSLNGSPMRSGGEGSEVMTLGAMAINVLLTPLIDPNTGNAEITPPLEKVRYAKLAQDIYSAAGPIDVSVDDISLIKGRIGRAGSPLAVARAWAILDPEVGGNTASDRVEETRAS